MKTHIFIDVEAFGPPGIGRPFALGAAKFDMERGVYARFQGNIAWPGTASVFIYQDTLEWLLRQEPEVLAQVKHGSPFAQVWADFQTWAQVVLLRDPPTFWADDWSDFAWLDIEAREHMLPPLREFGAQFDSSAITKAADPLRVYSTETYGELVPHVAGHDAVRGALDLLASIHSAPSRWRENMGFSS